MNSKEADLPTRKALEMAFIGYIWQKLVYKLKRNPVSFKSDFTVVILCSVLTLLTNTGCPKNYSYLIKRKMYNKIEISKMTHVWIDDYAKDG